jgi:hypothetical protein
VCADCGKPIKRVRTGRWAEVLDEGGYSFCCRTIISGTVLVRADYHHIDGEDQDHYP